MSVAMAEPPVCAPAEPAPPAWADLPPGPELAAALAAAEQRGMDDFELIEAMAAYRRLSSWAQAQEMGAVLSLSARRRRGPATKVLTGTADCSEFVPVEIALALGLTDYSAIRLTQRAHALANRFPTVFTALESGNLDMPKVLIILEKTRHLSDELCAKVETAILPQAFYQTTAQLRDTVEREVVIADPDTAEERRQEAIAQRRLVRHTTDHGTSGLYLLDAPPELTAAIYQRVTAFARRMKAGGDRCTMSVLRADVLTAWSLGADPYGLHECVPRQAPSPAPSDPRDPDRDLPRPEPADPHDWDDHAPDSRDDNGEPADRNDPERGLVPIDPDYPVPDDHDDGEPADGHEPEHGTSSDLADSFNLPDLPPPPTAPSDPYDWDDPDTGDGQGAGLSLVSNDADGDDDRSEAPDPSAKHRYSSGELGAVGGVTLIIPLDTARGRSQRPGELAGHGPILPAPARRLLAQAATGTVPWSWTVVDERGQAAYHGKTSHRPADPDDWDALLQDVRGQLADHADELDVTGCSADHPPPGESNSTRYLFTSADRRRLQVRDRTCRTPGCRYPARLCDADHTIPHHLGGPTCTCNGGPECRHHHRTKQQPGWRLDQPRPGRFLLTAPNGHQYVTEPDPYPT